MSWKAINELIGLATVDPAFYEQLLVQPLKAIQERGFELTPYELGLIETIQANDIVEFGQQLVAKLGPQQPFKSK